MKKLILTVAVLGLFGAVLTGCGSDEDVDMSYEAYQAFSDWFRHIDILIDWHDLGDREFEMSLNTVNNVYFDGMHITHSNTGRNTGRIVASRENGVLDFFSLEQFQDGYHDETFEREIRLITYRDGETIRHFEHYENGVSINPGFRRHLGIIQTLPHFIGVLPGVPIPFLVQDSFISGTALDCGGFDFILCGESFWRDGALEVMAGTFRTDNDTHGRIVKNADGSVQSVTIYWDFAIYSSGQGTAYAQTISEFIMH